MATRKRKVGSYATELVKKAREAMLTAVQIYNNPQIDFKSELFIVTSVVAWTYLMHAHYRKTGVEYRQTEPLMTGKRRRFLRTKYGAVRHWSLEQCLACEDCPVQKGVITNLMFLIGIRHEIEHQMTSRIDDQLSAKFMACALNFNSAIKMLFDKRYSLEKEQAFSIQFSSINEKTARALMDEVDLPQHIRSFVVQFESGMTQEDFDDPLFSYRVALVKKLNNNKNTADRVLQIVPDGSPAANAMNEVILKETERHKSRPSTIVKQMKAEGYSRFGITQHTDLWREKEAKNPKHQYGVDLEGTWMWYDSWVAVVRKHCQDHEARYKPAASIFAAEEATTAKTA